MSNREAAMMKIEQDKNKKNKSGNQRMTYMKQDNWRQEIISLNEGCKTFQPQSTLLVLIDFCPVQSELFTWSSVTKTFAILQANIIEYQIYA